MSEIITINAFTSIEPVSNIPVRYIDYRYEMFKNIVIAINKVIFESIDINQNINSDKKIFKNIASDIDKGSRRLKKSRIL